MEKEKIEQQLIPRLKWMAGTLLICSACALGYAIYLENTSVQNIELQLLFPQIEEAAASFSQAEERIPDVLNYFVISSIFATVGIACFLYALKKQKRYEAID